MAQKAEAGSTKMVKNSHEIRDPIHVFIRLESDERKIVNSRAFQRLRYIHQLALTYLLYPGATHRRFEHSLGVMELASRIFDVATRIENVTDAVRERLPEISDANKLSYWRRVLRIAALCHDIGHLPFSHAAEKELLPEGCDHEIITRDLILQSEISSILRAISPPVRPEDVVKLALGPKKARDLSFSAWELILSEIIVGDAFGADRMDYLLRDSHHAGVAYGRFDHFRLIDTIRILPASPMDMTHTAGLDPSLGVEEGGLHSAEALMLARYFMFSQLYLHPVRRIYDIHLKDFLKAWLPNGMFSTDTSHHLDLTDNEVSAAFLEASRMPAAKGHDPAKRLVTRDHFRLFYQRHPDDVKVNPESGFAVFTRAKEKFGEDLFRWDRYPGKGGAPDFAVQTRDNRVSSSLSVSGTLGTLPAVSIDYVFADQTILNDVQTWLKNDRAGIIRPTEGENP